MKKLPLSLPVTGALLAGGRGVRLGGKVKAALRVDGERLLDRGLAFLGGLCSETLLLPGPQRLAAPVRSLPDALPDRGPPGALLAALEGATWPFVFALAVDQPHPSLPAALTLWDALRRAGAEAALYVRDGRIEPLFGFYARSCAGPFRRQLERGNASFAALLQEPRIVLLPLAKAPEADRDGHFLESVNSPHDARRLGAR